MKIEALHDFHNKQFSEEWSSKFEPTTERLSLFQLITDNIKATNKKYINILELGIGPGFLAEYILSSNDNYNYQGIDFSKTMLNLASKRLVSHSNKLVLTEADLTYPEWKNKIKRKPDCIISTWSLHDLLSKQNIQNVYQAAFNILPEGGKLINGDFIKPEKSTYDYEKGRIKPSEHLELLRQCGFNRVECLKMFEENKDNPTTSNNYACFQAIK